jgi:hypothetical protein
MILYYAAGGGLGHLTRARALLHTLGLKDRVALLTASPFARDRRVVGDAEIIEIPQTFNGNLAAYQAWLRERLEDYQPAEIFLDSFPAGLVGEFCDFRFPEGTRLFHLARLLNWKSYARMLHGALPEFARTYVLEPLDAQHQAWLEDHSSEWLGLRLTDPPQELTDEVKQAAIRVLRPSVSELLVRHPQAPDRASGRRRPLWLVVHSGPQSEIDELIAYALEMSRLENLHPRLVLLAPRSNNVGRGEAPGQEPFHDLRYEIRDRAILLNHSQKQTLKEPVEAIDSRLQTPDSGLQSFIEHFDFYPASAIFPVAERIITGCGFNAMRQTESYSEKHRFIPFERRFDNQFARACRRKESASGYPKADS